MTDEEILEVLRQSSDPFLGTSEIADELPIKRNGTLQRLNELAERDMVQSKRIARVKIWWLPERVACPSDDG